LKEEANNLFAKYRIENANESRTKEERAKITDEIMDLYRQKQSKIIDLKEELKLA